MASPDSSPACEVDDSWPALLVEALDSGDEMRIRLITKLFYIELSSEDDHQRLHVGKTLPPVYRL